MKERGISVDASTQWLGALGEFVSYLCVGTDQSRCGGEHAREDRRRNAFSADVTEQHPRLIGDTEISADPVDRFGHRTPTVAFGRIIAEVLEHHGSPECRGGLAFVRPPFACNHGLSGGGWTRDDGA